MTRDVQKYARRHQLLEDLWAMGAAPLGSVWLHLTLFNLRAHGKCSKMKH